jgi:hypothetical protein
LVVKACPDCTTAKTQTNWGGYQANCQSCKARAISKSLAFWESQKAGKQTPDYRALLKRVGVTHEDVKGWAT